MSSKSTKNAVRRSKRELEGFVGKSRNSDPPVYKALTTVNFRQRVKIDTATTSAGSFAMDSVFGGGLITKLKVRRISAYGFAVNNDAHNSSEMVVGFTAIDTILRASDYGDITRRPNVVIHPPQDDWLNVTQGTLDYDYGGDFILVDFDVVGQIDVSVLDYAPADPQHNPVRGMSSVTLSDDQWVVVSTSLPTPETIGASRAYANKLAAQRPSI